MKKILLAAGVFILLIGGFAIKTLRDAGQFKSLKPHFSGTVREVSGITGGEDITIDFEKRIAYIGADDRFAMLNGRKGFGGLYALHLDNPAAAPKLLKRIPENEIHPHGISYYKTPTGQAYLYVVDHASGKHSILLYQFQDDTTLSLVKTFGDSPFMISPNDVAAVDEHRFYFTNDHGAHSSSGKLMEDYLQLKKADVIYYNGSEYIMAANRIAYCNGVNMNRERDEVYVASTIGKSIFAYKRSEGGALDFLQEIKLDTGVDNIELDEQGNLWVACHPQLLSFVKHAKDTSKLAPSQVIKLTRNADGKFTSEEIYLNLGEELSASSVAAVAGNTMLVGAVFDDHILRCEMR